MILTCQAIQDAVGRGDIELEPFDPSCLNPNSYNYRLASTLKWTRDPVLEPRSPANWIIEQIGKEGFELRPGHVYLGATMERIGSARYVPSLIGRSSMGRLGLFLQLAADMGNLGAVHHWTLELVVVQPLRVYAGMRIGQVSFWEPRGDIELYQGRYGDFDEPSPCMSPP